MKINIPTVSVILDSRRSKKNGLYPIKLRVTLKGEREYYPLGEDCSEDIWEAVLKPKGGSERVRELRNLKANCESNALSIIDSLKHFSFQQFATKYLGHRTSEIKSSEFVGDDVFTAIRMYADRLLQNDQVSSSESYESLLGSIQRFYPKKKLEFGDINVDFLKEYEKWMRTKGRKDGKPQRSAGIGIYMRNLKCIIKQALNSKIISIDEYPFGKDKYQPPIGDNVKKALTIEQLRAIQNYELPEGSKLQRSRDLWVFSYLCNGMNIKDICQLTWENIEGDTLHFKRAKTEHTRKQEKLIHVTILEPVKEIIKRWGSQEKGKQSYVFDILRVDMTATQVRYAVHDVVKRINSDMKQVANDLNMNVSVTTYVARHSYASQLVRSNVPVKYISDALGHSSLEVTQHYLANFDQEAQRQFALNLL